MTGEMAELPPKRIVGDGREDLALGVATGAADTVIHERDTGTGRGEPRTRTERASERQLGRIPDVKQAAQATASARTAPT